MNDIRYYYYRLGGGVVTAYTERIRGNLGAIYLLKVGFAFCSPKDNFIKERGRRISRGRAEVNGVYLDYNQTSRKTLEAFLFGDGPLEGEVGLIAPHWFKKARKGFRYVFGESLAQ